jgi:hypothetical protein
MELPWLDIAQGVAIVTLFFTLVAIGVAIDFHM